MTEEKVSVIEQMDSIAVKRDRWIKKNKYYYRNLIQFLQFNIPLGSRILKSVVVLDTF
jgi:hypothetical protein